MSDQQRNREIVAFLKQIDTKRRLGQTLTYEERSKVQEIQNSLVGVSKQRFIKDLSESANEKESDVETLLDDNIKRN